jgi:UDP-glucose 4-epimerase
MAELVGKALKMEPQINIEPTKLPGEVTHYIANISLAQELLGYVPQVPLDEGIARAVAWATQRKQE